MRPCPVERVGAAPAFLVGLAVSRGETIPVLDTALLLSGQSAPVTRFVVLRVGDRRIALTVAEVVGTQALAADAFGELPPLLAASSELVRGLGVLDGQLLEVLESGRLLEIAARAGDGAQAQPRNDAAS
jgi:purine-binding chemotaxis protein CheW